MVTKARGKEGETSFSLLMEMNNVKGKFCYVLADIGFTWISGEG